VLVDENLQPHAAAAGCLALSSHQWIRAERRSAAWTVRWTVTTLNLYPPQEPC
jgi:hypothetical protein